MSTIEVDADLYAKLCADHLRCRDKLLEWAKECSRCDGTGIVSRQYGGDGYGDKCCALADADDQICPDCADIREVLE